MMLGSWGSSIDISPAPGHVVEVVAAASRYPRAGLGQTGREMPRRSIRRRTASEDRVSASASAHPTQCRAHAAVIHCAALGQQCREGHAPTIRLGSTTSEMVSHFVDTNLLY